MSSITATIKKNKNESFDGNYPSKPNFDNNEDIYIYVSPLYISYPSLTGSYCQRRYNTLVKYIRVRYA